jgi:hypothetical protein
MDTSWDSAKNVLPQVKLNVLENLEIIRWCCVFITAPSNILCVGHTAPINKLCDERVTNQ